MHAVSEGLKTAMTFYNVTSYSMDVDAFRQERIAIFRQALQRLDAVFGVKATKGPELHLALTNRDKILEYDNVWNAASQERLYFDYGPYKRRIYPYVHAVRYNRRWYRLLLEEAEDALEYLV